MCPAARVKSAPGRRPVAADRRLTGIHNATPGTCPFITPSHWPLQTQVETSRSGFQGCVFKFARRPGGPAPVVAGTFFGPPAASTWSTCGRPLLLSESTSLPGPTSPCPTMSNRATPAAPSRAVPVPNLPRRTSPAQARPRLAMPDRACRTVLHRAEPGHTAPRLPRRAAPDQTQPRQT